MVVACAPPRPAPAYTPVVIHRPLPTFEPQPEPVPEPPRRRAVRVEPPPDHPVEPPPPVLGPPAPRAPVPLVRRT